MHNIETVEAIDQGKVMKTTFAFTNVAEEGHGQNYICYARHGDKELKSAPCPSKPQAKDDVCAKMLKDWDEYKS
ncbi:hypothetical protein EV182_004144 [Spiromyces aspiralis]|uniref:Uncharacterized protein n=1 Tax=Spiromyces aspiralis TaxID=68401 RepID=A0ACC1HCV3_9FUNG|nr:hypothetical protein EV182_004144 [Spiromyces aspiralis]